MNQSDQDAEIVAKAVQGLSRHFDTVQIHATRHDLSEEDGTIVVHHGCGNWYGRLGSVQHFLAREDERTRHEIRTA